MNIVHMENLRMKHSKSNTYLAWLLFVSVIAVATCFPTPKPERAIADEFNVEKHMPNGTVIGKYSYKDDNGNPIQIKYFADDSSYGVELKSFKVIDATKTPLHDPQGMYTHEKKVPEQYSPGQRQKLSSDQLTYENSIPYGNKRNGFNRYKAPKASDFEVFYQNQPQECGKEKVHIYVDKDRNQRNSQERKIRSVFDDMDDENKFCEQF